VLLKRKESGAPIAFLVSKPFYINVSTVTIKLFKEVSKIHESSGKSPQNVFSLIHQTLVIAQKMFQSISNTPREEIWYSCLPSHPFIRLSVSLAQWHVDMHDFGAGLPYLLY
jgi:hypothetical protein